MRILIATDGSEFSKAAVLESCKYIKDPESTAINVVSVFEDVLPTTIGTMPVSAEYYQQVEDSLSEMAATNVKDAETDLRKQFSGHKLDVVTEVLRGFPDQTIIEEAKQWKADLIVVGSHGRGFWGRLLGSVSSGVVHHALCPVLVVRKRII